MKKVDTHGLTIKGLKAACGQTCNWPPRSGGYTEVFYDLSTGEVWTVDQIGFNSWTEYQDPDIIKVCNSTTRLKMQDIADLIRDAVASHRRMKEFYSCSAND